MCIRDRLSSRPEDEAVLTRAEALDMASAFLKARGFPAMKESYFIDQGDVLTIHFAALEGEVLCYPDLVKVAVALDNGDVVGFESAGFLMNHRTRQLSEAAISESAASQVVGSSLEILSHQLTLIPSGGEYEVLCHEFKCRTQEDTLADLQSEYTYLAGEMEMKTNLSAVQELARIHI